MNHMKRMLAMLLALVMIVGVLPLSVLAAEDTVTGNFEGAATSILLDAAIFCSDVHGKPSTVTSVFNGIKNADSTFKPSTVSFVGDTQTTASSVTSVAQGVFPGVSCYYAFGNHDDEGNYGIKDVTGLIYGDSSTNYYIYAISENSMASSNPSTTDFTNTVAGLDKTKPLFIISHLPLHSRRGDSNGAAVWYSAISAAANEMDIFFFWAHNHTGDNAVDRAAYYVAKNGSETITLENTTTVVTPNFTYANAGYINPPNTPARNNVATAVRIYNNSVKLTVYNASGELTGTYAVNETITREFAPADPKTLAVTGSIEYLVGDALRNPTKAVVNYTDGAIKELNVSDLKLTITTEDGADLEDGKFVKAGTYKLTYAYTENGMTATATLTVTVSDNTPVVTGIEAVSNKSAYALGEDLDLTVYEVYSDGTKVEIEGYTVSGYNSSKLGTQSVFVSYGIYTVTVSVQVVDLTAESVLTGLLVSYSKETLLGGTLALKVTAVYEGGTFVELTEGQYTVSGYDPNVIGTQGIIVTYETQSYGFNIINTDDVTVVADGMKSMTVTNVTETLTDALAEQLKPGFVAYDIVPDAYNVEKNVAVVSMPAPEGANAVYYWNEETQTLEPVSDVTFENGKAVFTTDHFSTYVVGEDNSITAPDPTTVTVSGSTTKKTVYVLTSSPSAGNDYLIVNGNEAGDYFALANNNGSVAATGVTVKTDSTIGTYIELADAADELWTVASGLNFNNGSQYLGYTTSGSWGNSYTFGLSTTKRSWSYSTSNNRLSTSVGSWNSTTYYLQYDSGWTWTSSSSASGTSVYFYEASTITVSNDGTYSIAGNPAEITKAVTEGAKLELGSILTFQPTSGAATTTDTSATADYSVYSDPNGVISGISGNTVTFTGNYGKALVKVSYIPAGADQATTNYIVVNASEHTYTLDLWTHDGSAPVAEITAPVALKNVTKGYTYSVWAVIKADGEDIGALKDPTLIKWTSSDTSIATVDPATGIITFTGKDGTVNITATYQVGNKPSDTITISATSSQYIVPGDGTDDFRDYPNEGAIRFDKTATAVGNFSETGIVKVELSMTGVPYTTGSEIDVVVMLDMTGSMSTNGMEAAELATIAFMEKIVKNEDGSYNENRIAVYAFNSGSSSPYELVSLKKITSDSELATATTAIKTASNKQTSGGTPFDEAAQKCQSVLAAAKTDGTGNNRQQFCVFMSDGGPTTYKGSDGYTYYGGNASGDRKITSYIGGYSSSSSSSWTYNLPTEYYTDAMKADGVTVYTVGLLMQNVPSSPSPYSSMTKSTYDSTTDTLTSIGSHYYFTSTILKNMASDESKYIDIFNVDNASKATAAFEAIALSILQAATDVTVEDKITDEYTMIFGIPKGTQKISGVTNDFYIEFLKYALDANHERTTSTSVTKLYLIDSNGDTAGGTYSAGSSATEAYAAPVFENKVIGDKGTLYYWTTDSSYASKAAVSYTVGGTTYYFFPYGIKAKDSDYDATKWFNMTSGAYAYGTIDATTNMSTDLVIATPYFVYNAATQKLYWTVDKIDTTEYALRYFLYLEDSATEVGTGKEKDPGTYKTNEYAYLTYTNFQGKDVRQEFVKPQMTWNGAQVSYVFYLVNAQGQPINKAGQVVDFANAVFVTEIYTKSVIWNDTDTPTMEGVAYLDANWTAGELLPSGYTVFDANAHYTLYVYEDHEGNTLDSRFTIAGSNDIASKTTTKVYITKADKTKYDTYGTYYKDDVYSGFDFANTTVAFAVVWLPALVEDTVVVDFGLDVVIDVTKNDLIDDNQISGIGKDQPTGAVINSGVYADSKLNSSSITLKDGNKVTIEGNKIRFQQGDMIFTAPSVFYYESKITYYQNGAKQAGYLYTGVTVIPATTIYYEDSFISNDDLHSYEWENNGWKDLTTGIGDGDFDWMLDGTAVSGTQAQDRPGTNVIVGVVDADNNYGYDDAYSSMSQYSMGSALKVHVDYDHMAKASFDFWGTGFDVISLTSNTTGTIIVNVYDTSDKQVKSFTVNTYYGMKYENGEWVTTTSADPNALYQVPVMKISGLTYGQYRAEIKVVYDPIFDQGLYENASYDFYLDAVRIYDPTGNRNGTANDAYVKDGEGWPTYAELRDLVIDATGVTVGSDGKVTIPEDAVLSGLVFIDGISGTNSVENYMSYGPNNELYLANGQSIAFVLNKNGTDFAKAGYEADKVQLAIKSVGGSGKVLISYQDGNELVTFQEIAIETATDMYYDITKLDGKTVVIQSTGNAIISLTNIKVTYKVAQTTSENGEPPVSIMSLNRAAAAAEAETYLISVNAEMIEKVLNILNGKVEVEPERPFEPAPGKPSKPGSGNKPVAPKPSQPIKPSVPAKPIKPVRPVVPTMPVNPGLPGIPGRPAPVVAIHIY